MDYTVLSQSQSSNSFKRISNALIVLLSKLLHCDWPRAGHFIVNFETALQCKNLKGVYNFLCRIINKKARAMKDLYNSGYLKRLH